MMNTMQKWLGPVLFSLCLGGGIALGVQTLSAEGVTADGRGETRKTQTEIAPVTHPMYNKECGSCHFAYQPGWLPVRSWEKLMSGLRDHFGENAELPPDGQRQLTDWLRAQAGAPHPKDKGSKMVASIAANDTPLRITTLPYFQKEHRKIPERMWKGNPKVVSLSRCETCHPQAAKGSFEEHQVQIPGHGPWKD